MSFSKAKIKRFNDVPVPVTSPFPVEKKEKMFANLFRREPKNVNATGVSPPVLDKEHNTKSSKPMRLFRTPSLPRRLKFRHHSDLTPKKNEATTAVAAATANCATTIPTIPVFIKDRDALLAVRAELHTKNATLAECEALLDRQKNRNQTLHAEVARLEAALVDTDTVTTARIVDLEVQLQRAVEERDTSAQRLHDMEKSSTAEHAQLRDTNVALEMRCDQLTDDKLTCATERDMLANENMNMELELENMSDTVETLNADLHTVRDTIATLEDDLRERQIEVDLQRDELRDAFNGELGEVARKYEQQLATIRTASADDRQQLIDEHTALVARLEQLHADELCAFAERTDEQIRIADVQAEQKLHALETVLANERRQWRSEIEKCQKIAETEITQCEFEKQDLKALLESANEMMRTGDDRIHALEERVRTGSAGYAQARDEYENELIKAKQDCARAQTERYNYQLTLTNTRSTLNILTERLKKSDNDVELLKDELKTMQTTKEQCELKNCQLENELQEIRNEMDEYVNALSALRQSSATLEQSMRDKDNVFEKLMTSEEEMLATANQIGTALNDKMNANFETQHTMYEELRAKYDIRETYIKDMKALLDELSNGIELATLEIDEKTKRTAKLEEENRSIQLENMTLKFRCEQFEKYTESGCDRKHQSSVPPTASQHTVHELGRGIAEGEEQIVQDDEMVPNYMIAKIISQLEESTDDNDERNVDEKPPNSIVAIVQDENEQLKTQLTDQSRQIEILQMMIEMESDQSTENLELNRKLDEMKIKMRSLEKEAHTTSVMYNELQAKIQQQDLQKSIHETDGHLKKKILQLQMHNEDQEHTIVELRRQMAVGTPTKKGLINRPATPKTPKTPILFAGKENQSPATTNAALNGLLSPISILRTRNN